MTYKLQIFLEMIKVAKSSKYNRNTLWHSLVAKIWNQTISHIKNTCKDNCSIVTNIKYILLTYIISKKRWANFKLEIKYFRQNLLDNFKTPTNTILGLMHIK